MLNLTRVTTVAVEWMTVAYLVCAAGVALLPGPSVWMSQRAFHMMGGYNFSDNPMLSMPNLLVGLVFWDIVAYLGAALFVWLWNRSSK